MSFEDINDQIRAKTGGFTNLKNKGDKVSGKILDVEARDQSFKGKVLLVTGDGPRKGQPRREWLFSLELADGSVTKWAAKENAQWAITGALNGRKLEKGGYLQVEVVEKEDQKQPEHKAVYSGPTPDSPFEGTKVPDTDEPPF